MTPHLEELVAALAALTESGFQLTEQRTAPGHFGDAFAVATSSTVRVRLLSDRGQIFADVASVEHPDAWFELRSILKIITGDTASGPWASPHHAVSQLRNNLGAVDHLLGDPDKTKDIRHAP